MSTLFYERTPFDILVRNFFQDASNYSPLAKTKVPHPVDIYTTDTHLVFDIAATGIAKEDIEIQTQSNILKVNYTKPKKEDTVEYIHKGIAKRSFNLYKGGDRHEGKGDDRNPARAPQETARELSDIGEIPDLPLADGEQPIG